MRAVLAMLSVAFLAACAGDGERSESPAGEVARDAAREAERQARDRCAAEGRRAQLRNVFENSDGSRRYEYRCVP